MPSSFGAPQVWYVRAAGGAVGDAGAEAHRRVAEVALAEAEVQLRADDAAEIRLRRARGPRSLCPLRGRQDVELAVDLDVVLGLAAELRLVVTGEDGLRKRSVPVAKL